MVLSMVRWVGKVAIVTGASAGIGAAIAKQLVESGMIVAGLARRKEKMEKLAAQLEDRKSNWYALKCDLTNEEEILDAFKWVETNLGPVHVLVNNAGIVMTNTLSAGDSKLWRKLIDTNMFATLICAREAISSMKSNGIDGHIINMNSVLGHSIPLPCLMSNLYIPMKYALTASSEVLRLELASEKSLIRVTSLSPGGTRTEIQEVSGINTEEFQNLFVGKILSPEDIADAVTYILSTPPHVQIKELIIKPTGELV